MEGFDVGRNRQRKQTKSHAHKKKSNSMLEIQTSNSSVQHESVVQLHLPLKGLSFGRVFNRLATIKSRLRGGLFKQGSPPNVRLSVI